jgi:hypothetical protein
MTMSEPLEMSLVKDRLEEARAQAALQALVDEIQARPPLRVRVGLGLARLGAWIAGGTWASQHGDPATASAKR